MQRTYTIELVVDYADTGKYDATKKACASMARNLYATVSFLNDQVEPKIAVFSDDYFQGHEEIALLDDTIAMGTHTLTDAPVESLSKDMQEAFGIT